MILNILLGFIVPWIVTLKIVKERKFIYYIAPFASVVSFIVNNLGFHYFWKLYPFELGNVSALPFNIGLFCLYPCINLHIMKKYNIKAYIRLPISSLMLTLSEGVGILLGRVIYRNHWNIIATYCSYFISLTISYIFYTILNEKKLI